MVKIKNIFAFVITLMASSCSFFEVDPQVICSETFYNSEEEVLYGLAGVYGVMSNEPFYGNYYSLMCSNVDDLSYFNRATTTNYTQVYAHDASATEIYAAWTEIYKGIRNANSYMEAVLDTGFDSAEKYYNEARFLRAYYHFILAQAWGDVPLKTKASTSVPMYVITWFSRLVGTPDALSPCDVIRTNSAIRSLLSKHSFVLFR